MALPPPTHDPTTLANSWTAASTAYNTVIGATTLHGTRRLASVIHTLSPLLPTSSVLDVGAGGGSLTACIHTLSPTTPILATDISPGMLAQISAINFPPNVRTQCEDAVGLAGLADASFTHALSTFAVQFTPDPRAAMESLHRVTKPGGVVAVAVWGAAFGAAMLSDQAAGNVLGGKGREFVPIQHGSERAWNTEERHREELERTGLEEVGTERCWMRFEAGGMEGTVEYWFRSENPIPVKMIRDFERQGGDRAELEREYRRLLQGMRDRGEEVVCEGVLGWGRKPL